MRFERNLDQDGIRGTERRLVEQFGIAFDVFFFR